MKLLLLFLLIGSGLSAVAKMDLSANWVLTLVEGPPEMQSLRQKTFNITIPSVVHLQLQETKQIPDPFLSNNAAKIKWVSECKVKYSVEIKITNELLSRANMQHNLVFEGIDTYSRITLNGKEVQTTNNAFRRYTVSVTDLLKVGLNLLEVTISPTSAYDSKGQQDNRMPFAYAHTRKACYQYSWDWAPFVNTLGIWQGVYLESFPQVKIDYVWARVKQISQEKAIINFAVALQLGQKEQAVNKNQFTVRIMHDENNLGEFPVIDKYTYGDIVINNPRLWWPHGIGEPNIYQFKVLLILNVDQSQADKKELVYGIRSVSLDRDDNEFAVRINGYRVYCKGANYVPPDMFYPRLTNPRFVPGNTIKQLLADAVQSHFNMIRIWGGGQYESNEFLEEASRLGIMVFYDFMFSDSIYPSTEQFLLNVQEEVKQQIRRARNYPCLTIWSGNNEVKEGILKWGWDEQRYQQDYARLFERLIAKIVEYESPYIPYIPSSPDLGRKGSKKGDIHYWGVWAAQADFQEYQNNVGSFNSQFGTQSLPVWKTVKEMVVEGELSYDSAVLLTHERHSSQFSTLQSYMKKYAKTALNFELETYQSGLIQAYGLEIAIKAQRSSKPKSSGTLYWQLNDAWPAISWSAIDYFGRWKPLQYMAKRIYPDIAIFTLGHSVHVINDKPYSVKARIFIEVLHLQGDNLLKKELNMTIPPNSATKVFLLADSVFKGQESKVAIYTEIVAGKGDTMRDVSFLVPYKQLELPQNSGITVQFFDEFKMMRIASQKVIKSLHIYSAEGYVRMSENYFDVVPGHPVSVQVISPRDFEEIKKKLKFRSYYQVYNAQQLTVQII